MNVYSIVVTYGNRFPLLSQVIDGLLASGVHKIIVVDNKSTESSVTSLKNRQKEIPDKLHIIFLPSNTGSAFAYKVGLEYAYADPDCDFIWFLDDDNVPQPQCLKYLTEYWEAFVPDKNKQKTTSLCLFCYRGNMDYYREAIQSSNSNYVLFGPKNSFLKFEVFEIPQKIWKRIVKPDLNKIYDQSINAGIVPVASYGGMFFHKDLLDVVGYPDATYYLYADDFDFSYRITLSGGKIMLLLKAAIDDVDKAWHYKDNKKKTYAAYLTMGDEVRFYYHFRNRVYFELKYLITNRTHYLMNIFAFISIIFYTSLVRLTFKRFNVIVRAIRDGFKGKMGMHKKYNYNRSKHEKTR